MESSSLPPSGSTVSPSPVYGPTNRRGADGSVRRYASAVELRPEKERLYRELHAQVWPGVVEAIKDANICNYSIFIATIDGKRYLFSYFEYTGSDPKADFGSIASDPTTRDEWWPLTDACQRIIDGTPEGQQWLPMEQVMHIS